MTDPTDASSTALGGVAPMEGPLIERVSWLIKQARRAVASQTNAALTLMNWHIGSAP